MLITQWSFILRRLGLVLALYLALRLLFLVYNQALFAEATAGEIALAFLHGLRFDLAATIATNAIFLLLCLLPRQVPMTPGYQRLLKGVFLGLNIPFLLINTIDLEYFRFNGRRSTVELLSLAGDAGVKWLALASTYWVILLLGAAAAAALWIFYGRVAVEAAPRTRRLGPVAWAVNLLVGMAFAVIAVRGGLQSKPISPADAATLGRSELAQLALNSSLTVIKSYRKTPLRRYRYFEPEALLPYLRATVNGEKTIPDVPRRDNIVILILESFSAEYWGAGNGGSRYTPFLDSLADQSLFLSRNYANGRRSRDAVPAILAGLPALMPDSMLESLYAANDLVGLGTLLTPLGYTTSFFHGATTGTMHFDAFMRIAGIQHYFGLEDYPDANDFDGKWGVFDEPYLQYVSRELSQQKPPFAAVIFTVTSHNPYPIPEKYRGRFSKGTLPIHETIGYTDYALEQFFATARKQPWFANTLFIITGDHTETLETPEYLNALGQYRVPLLIYHPGFSFSGVDRNRVTQHADILPSVLDYLGLEPDRRLLFGKSIFRSGGGRAFLNANGHYWLIRDQDALEFVPVAGSRLYSLGTDPQLRNPITDATPRREEMEREAKALLQYFNNGTLDNRLYDWTSRAAPGKSQGP
jgi:arylsulfatase A-like enzyme